MDMEELSLNSNISYGGTSESNEDILFFDEIIPDSDISQKKECTLFLIDCVSSMHFLFDKETTTPLTSILNIIEAYIKIKIMSNENISFGIILFNTSNSKNEMNLEGVNYLTQIHSPDANSIKKLKDISNKCNPLLNKENYLKELNTIFPIIENHEKNFINNGLIICQSLLKNYDKDEYKRRIFIFTNEEDPFKTDLDEKNKCIQTGKEINDNDIIIEIFPMTNKDKFNLSIFYSSILPTSSDDDINAGSEHFSKVEQCHDLLKHIFKRMRKRDIKTSYVTKMPFHITPNTSIYMNIYSIIKKESERKPNYIEIKTNKLLKSTSYMKCKESGKELNSKQIGNYIFYGKQKLQFSKEDMKKVRMNEDSGITLLGFKAIENIKPYHNFRESLFLYPNEISSKGSGKLINALIKQMLHQGKCAMVRLVTQEGTIVKLCALFPQIERYNEEFFQTPPGLNMVFLPWGEDIRLESDILSKFSGELPYISDKLSFLAKELIVKMNFNFDCRNYENYDLKIFYENLYKIAVNDSKVEKIEDSIQPNEEELKRALDGIDEKYKQLSFGKDVDIESEIKKRKEMAYNLVGEDSESRSSLRKRSNKKKRKKRKYVRKNRKLLLHDEVEEEENRSLIKSVNEKETEAKNEKNKVPEKKEEENKVPEKKENDNDSSSSSISSIRLRKMKKKRRKRGRPRKKNSSDSSSDSENESEESITKLTNTQLTKMFKTNEVQKMTVTQLKTICKIRGISTYALKKHDILNRLKSKLYVFTHY